MSDPLITSDQQRILEQLQTVMQQFKPLYAENYAGCAREVVFCDGKITLYHYTPLVKKVTQTPTLIVYAMVNRPTILDLQQDISLIHQLLTAGLDVYLIDWGYPEQADSQLTLENYLADYLHAAVNSICQRYHLKKINVLGICQGGVFSLCYSSLYPQQIKNVVTMITPVDFHTPDSRITQLLTAVDIDLLVQRFGNIPGKYLTQLFIGLKPYQNTLGKVLDLIHCLDKREELIRFLRVEQWLLDNPDQPAEVFRQFAQDFYQGNKLMRGEVRIGKRRVNLQKITMPVFNMFARDDHIVPAAASRDLAKYIKSIDYTDYVFPGGHIGIYISRRAQHQVPAAIAEWLWQRDSGFSS